MEVLSTLGGSAIPAIRAGCTGIPTWHLQHSRSHGRSGLAHEFRAWMNSAQSGQPTNQATGDQQVINRWPPNCLQFEILLVKSKERLFSLDFSLFQKKKSSGVGPQFQVRLVDDNDLTQSGVIFTSKCRNWATNEVCRPQNFEKTETIDAKNVIKPSCHLTCKCYQHLKELCKCIVSIKMHWKCHKFTLAL